MSHWTKRSLLAYVLRILDERDRLYGARFTAQETAVAAALAAAEKRLDSMNEFRGALSDKERLLMPRAEATVLIAALDDKIRGAQRVIEALQAERKGVAGGWGLAVGVVGFVLSIASIGALLIRSVRP